MGVSASARPPAAMRSATDPNHTPGRHASGAAELSRPRCGGAQRRVTPLTLPERRKPRRKRVLLWGSPAVLGRVTHEASLGATVAATAGCSSRIRWSESPRAAPGWGNGVTQPACEIPTFPVVRTSQWPRTPPPAAAGPVRRQQGGTWQAAKPGLKLPRQQAGGQPGLGGRSPPSSFPQGTWVCEVQPWARLCSVPAPSPTNKPRRPAASQASLPCSPRAPQP